MAHCGQELAFSLVGRLGLLPRLDKLADIDYVQQDSVVPAVPVNGLHAKDHFLAAKGTLKYERTGNNFFSELLDLGEDYF